MKSQFRGKIIAYQWHVNPLTINTSTDNSRSAFLRGSLGERGVSLPAFEGCSADTIMEVAVWAPVTNDWVDAVGTSVPWGVVITNPAKRERETVIRLSAFKNQPWHRSIFNPHCWKRGSACRFHPDWLCSVDGRGWKRMDLRFSRILAVMRLF